MGLGLGFGSGFGLGLGLGFDGSAACVADLPQRVPRGDTTGAAGCEALDATRLRAAYLHRAHLVRVGVRDRVRVTIRVRASGA